MKEGKASGISQEGMGTLPLDLPGTRFARVRERKKKIEDTQFNLSDNIFSLCPMQTHPLFIQNEILTGCPVLYLVPLFQMGL